MQNLLSLWSALDARRRAIVVGATVATMLAVLGLARVAGAPNMALLYAGLDGAAAGEVVAALDQQGARYEIRGDSIFVDEAARDTLRMTLAASGLPASGGQGYELLDTLSGFGTTAQMFDAAYLRAKEGELARTILANPQVKAARVHIAMPASQPFLRDQRATASVTLTTVSGALSQSQAKALQHLVSAAVAGMQPADVAIIDSVSGLILTEGEGDSFGPEDRTTAEGIRRNVERLLAARVGPGKAVVEVFVDFVRDREQITERRFDPQGRVAISSETEERSDSRREPGGEVTVASNLPEGDAGAGESGQSQSSETRERVNYEVSETQRELLRAPGAIRKLSVAVLVDGNQVTAADGTVTWEPRPEEELAILRELVASAVGLDEARGDVLTLKSLAFQPATEAGTLVEAGFIGDIDVMTLVQTAVLALVSLILGLFVLRPILTSSARRPAEIAATAPPLALPRAAGDTAAPDRVLTGEIDEAYDLSYAPPVTLTEGHAEELPADPVSRLRRLIEERQAESVEIIRSWMEAEDETA